MESYSDKIEKGDVLKAVSAKKNVAISKSSLSFVEINSSNNHLVGEKVIDLNAKMEGHKIEVETVLLGSGCLLSKIVSLDE